MARDHDGTSHPNATVLVAIAGVVDEIWDSVADGRVRVLKRLVGGYYLLVALLARPHHVRDHIP